MAQMRCLTWHFDLALRDNTALKEGPRFLVCRLVFYISFVQDYLIKWAVDSMEMYEIRRCSRCMYVEYPCT